tara:strand:+ start:6335 stop:6934 length:600 start_codon:yes stop_codon:yes gene_type:complete
MIGIINYGLGNIRAYYNIYKDNGIDLKIISNHKEIDSKIKKLILPGIGYFDKAIELLKKKNFFEEIKNFSINNSNKILGICVGMQILTNGSEEGKLNGLGLIDENFVKLPSKILPHIGWNRIILTDQIDLMNNINENSYFYFLHSYSLLTKNSEISICETFYEKKFISIFQKRNIYGIQFHPEKSHKQGTEILLNFYRN